MISNQIHCDVFAHIHNGSVQKHWDNYEDTPMMARLVCRNMLQNCVTDLAHQNLMTSLLYYVMALCQVAPVVGQCESNCRL